MGQGILCVIPINPEPCGGCLWCIEVKLNVCQQTIYHQESIMDSGYSGYQLETATGFCRVFATGHIIYSIMFLYKLLPFSVKMPYSETVVKYTVCL